MSNCCNYNYKPLCTSKEDGDSILGDSDDDESQVEGKGDAPEGKEQLRIFGWPVSIAFIVFTEFCERFCYYGMRTVLMIFLVDKLRMSEITAKYWYHEFMTLCYFTPLLGALMADLWMGKYLTILIMSMVYMIGNGMLSVTSVGQWFTDGTFTDSEGEMEYQPFKWGPLLALHLIALGTGGIKPCVSAFGGDQLKASEEDKLQKFFSIFYFSINAGSLIATYLTPIIRSTECMGESTCFPVAFGIPALFMVIAIVFFVVASPWYNKVKPKGNPITMVLGIIFRSIHSVITSGVNTGTHFFDRAKAHYEAVEIDDTKQLMRVLAIFIPFPFFWALFEQQGSMWIIQAKGMDGRLGGMTLLPDQMQVFNPVLVMIMIPVFEIAIYPALRACKVPTTPLARMIGGMTLVALSFVVCGIVEAAMEGKFEIWKDSVMADADALKNWTLTHNETVNGKIEPIFLVQDTPKDQQLHILLVLPQIFMITCGEIMASITGLEFAYAQAPKSMKSVCSSVFLLTNSMGNLVVMIFGDLPLTDSQSYFFWAGVQLFGAVLLFIIARVMAASLLEYQERMMAEANAAEGNDPAPPKEIPDRKGSQAYSE